MLRPYAGDVATPSRPSPKGMKQRRALVVLGLPLMVILGLVSPMDLFSSGGLRKLAVKCVHNVYALDKQMALDMPNPPAIDALLEIPSYISICKDWVQRASGEQNPVFTVEDDSVCMDWTSPHERLLEIISSSILDRVNGKSRYRHDCYRTRQFDEAVIGMDRTTIQQVIPVARMDPHITMISSDDMKAQCKVCLANFEPEVEKAQFKAITSHHCFGFPQKWEGSTWDQSVTMTIAGKTIVVPEEPVPPNVVPLSVVFKQVRNRLGYAAKIFSNVTDAPPQEHISGVVIYLDPTSKGVAKELYAPFFPAKVTSISVLSSPLCATAILATGQECLQYARDLVEYFKTIYPDLHHSGFHGLQGIQYQMVASTAGAFSRMILAKKLICPPATPSCLFPGMSKMIDLEAGFDTSAVIMECLGSTNCGKATAFYMNVGHGQRMSLELVDIPPDMKRPLSKDVVIPLASNGLKAAAQFKFVMVDDFKDEGYAKGKPPTKVKMARSVAGAISDDQILASIASLGLPNAAANPNVYVPLVEVPVDMVYVMAREVDDLPINLNYGTRGTDLRVMDELGLDCDTDFSFARRALSPEIFKAQIKLREASQKRIAAMVKKSKKVQMEDASNGHSFPGMEMEVYCPEVTADGYEIEIKDGTTRLTKNDRVIISDGAGTVVFDKDDLKEKTVMLPRDAKGGQIPVTFIYDPVTKKNITIAGKNITINKSDGTIGKASIGMLLIDNQTSTYTATLVTEGASGNLHIGETQKIYSGTVISTGMNRADPGSVVRKGNAYAIQEDPFPGEKRSGMSPQQNTWDEFNSRDSIYSTAETGVRDLDRDIVNRKQPKELSKEDQYTYDAKSPDPPAIRRQLLQNDMSRGVPILIDKNDYNFGNPDEISRVCNQHKDKVIAASKEIQALLADAEITASREL